MARSLRDELLKAGLVTSEQASRAERGSRALSKPARNRAGGKRHGNTRHRAARSVSGGEPREGRADAAGSSRAVRPASGGEPRESSGRRSPVPVPPPSPDPEERVKQLNLEIRRLLDTEAEKVEAETDMPFHFPRGDRLKRLYVSEDQRRRLVAGELAVVGFRGRHHLVPRPAGERVRELRPEVFVFIAAGDDGANEVEEGYEGYEVPDELMW